MKSNPMILINKIIQLKLEESTAPKVIKTALRENRSRRNLSKSFLKKGNNKKIRARIVILPQKLVPLNLKKIIIVWITE